MSDASKFSEELPERLLPAEPGTLAADELDALWQLFGAIASTWGSGTGGDGSPDPLAQRSQWQEFIAVRTQFAPSYMAEYRSAAQVLAELNQRHGPAMWEELFFGQSRTAPPTTRLGHLRRYVIDEFIKVWLTSGGFKAFGAGNFNGYVSGSRFAVKPPYRLLLK